jgi:hypothetical protein
MILKIIKTNLFILLITVWFRSLKILHSKKVSREISLPISFQSQMKKKMKIFGVSTISKPILTKKKEKIIYSKKKSFHK